MIVIIMIYIFILFFFSFQWMKPMMMISAMMITIIIIIGEWCKYWRVLCTFATHFIYHIYGMAINNAINSFSSRSGGWRECKHTHTHPNIHTLIIEEEKIRSQNKRKKKKWTKWTEMCLRYGIRYSREAGPLDTAIRYVRGVAYRRILFFFCCCCFRFKLIIIFTHGSMCVQWSSE